MPRPSEEHLQALDELYRTTRNVRLRPRAPMIRLSAEHHLRAAAIAAMVRESENTLRCWLKRYLAEGIAGLQDTWAGGAPLKVTQASRDVVLQVVRRRPRSLGQPSSLWALQRLADYRAEQTGIRVEDETVRVQLKAAEMVWSRPQHTISRPDPASLVKKRRWKPLVTD